MWVSFWSLFCSIELCICLCQYHTLLMTVTLHYSLKLRDMISPAMFFLKIALIIQGLLCFHTNFKILCSTFVKKCHCSFDRDCIEPIDWLGKYGHFNDIQHTWTAHTTQYFKKWLKNGQKNWTDFFFWKRTVDVPMGTWKFTQHC